MWVVETSACGRRKRQFFDSEAQAKKAFDSIKKYRSEVGKGFDALSFREKMDTAIILGEIAAAGMTLGQVWRIAQSSPPPAGNKCTLREAVNEVLAEKRANQLSTRHQDTLEWYLGHFIKGREKMDVSRIGVREIQAWFAERKEAPSSQRSHAAVLSTLFQHCWRRGYITENPCRRLAPLRITRSLPSVLTMRQCQQAVAWAHNRKPKILGWLALTLFAGLRPDSEADLVSWDDIDLDRGRLIVRKSKTRTPRILDLAFCPPALAWLKRAEELKSPMQLSHSQRRRYVRDMSHRLGYKRWPQDVLRHTAASNLLAYHQDAGKVAEFMGHSAGVLLRNYKALVFKEDAERWMAMKPATSRHRHSCA